MMSDPGDTPVAPAVVRTLRAIREARLARIRGVLVHEASRLAKLCVEHGLHELAELSEIGAAAEARGVTSDDFEVEFVRTFRLGLKGIETLTGFRPEPPSLEPINLIEWADKSPPPLDWLVEGLIPVGSVTALYADGGTGKSMLALDLMLAAARGGEWLGRKVEEASSVGLFAEDDDHECIRRARRLAVAGGFNLAEVAHRVRIISLAAQDPTLMAFQAFGPSGETTPALEALEAHVEASRSRLLIIDHASAVFGGNENDRSQVQAFLRTLAAVARRQGVAVVLLGHPSVEGLRNSRGHSGSTAWHNNVRTFLHLEREEKESGERTLKMTVRKNNYGRTGEVLCFSFDGDAFETITGPRAADSRKQPKLTRPQTICLDALRRALDAAGEPSPGGDHMPASVRTVRTSTWKDFSRNAGLFDPSADAREKEENRFQGAFRDCREALRNKGLIGLWADYAWLV